MSNTPEGKVKKRVKEILDAHAPDVWYFMPVAGPFGRAGIPDFILCVKGKFVSIETKANGNKPTGIQELIMERIRLAGGTTLVINENNINIIEELLQ